MFERFTDRARRVVVLAQEEARLLDHNYIGTEHILLGLIHEGEGVAARALGGLGISLDAVRAQVERIIGRGPSTPAGHIPFTPRSKKVLELSLREALKLNHNYIGTEHILLGLIREGEGVAAQVLVKLGADLSRVRQQVMTVLEQSPAESVTVREEAGGSEEEWQEAVAGEGPAELARVVPVARQLPALEGHALVLVALDVWSRWCELRWALRPGVYPPRLPGLLAQLSWRLTDDLGSTYERRGTHVVHQRPSRSAGAIEFTPPPPATATRLTVTVSGPEGVELAAVEIPLDGGVPLSAA
jgi:Clp amino terminal domain, pathogenicity island component